jgi:hypothetical protein
MKYISQGPGEMLIIINMDHFCDTAILLVIGKLYLVIAAKESTMK